MKKVKQEPEARRWWTLVVILAATFMAILDNNIVNVAIPSIQQALRADFAQIEAVIAGYALAYAVMLVTGGRLGDLYGRKRLFQTGMLGFTLASLLCGLSPTAFVLIAARLLQGLAASLMVPQVLALIQVNFVARERGIAFGFYGATFGLASIAGQIVGGFLISSNAFGLGWRTVFLINVPIGLLTMLAAFPLLRESTADTARRLDLPGVGLLTAGLLLLVYPLVEGRNVGWPSWTFISMVLAVGVLALFLLYEQRVSRSGGEPLVPLSLFRERVFNLGMVTLLVFYSGLSSFFFVLSLYLQIGLGFSPLAAGWTFVPLSLSFAISSLASPRLIPRLGAWVVRGGTIIMITGDLWTLLVVQQAEMAVHAQPLLLPFLVMGIGEGMVLAPLLPMILGSIHTQHAGAASGVLTTTMQIAGVLGVAVIGLLFFGVLGQRLPAQPLQLAQTYGHAFVISLEAIILLAGMTLICIIVLSSAKRAGKSEPVRTSSSKTAV
ncbi:MFS transporter [Ktedonosporobacter rubrisoli]|nr:MFS transporter [Ktedonosporobacter rubrisoli]